MKYEMGTAEIFDAELNKPGTQYSLQGPNSVIVFAIMDDGSRGYYRANRKPVRLHGGTGWPS